MIYYNFKIKMIYKKLNLNKQIFNNCMKNKNNRLMTN